MYVYYVDCRVLEDWEDEKEKTGEKIGEFRALFSTLKFRFANFILNSHSHSSPPVAVILDIALYYHNERVFNEYYYKVKWLPFSLSFV